MSENKTILTTRRFELWWRKAQAWFVKQFASISFDLTRVAKQGTNPNASLTEVNDKIGELDEIIESINGDNIDGIINSYMDDYAEQLEEIIGTNG